MSHIVAGLTLIDFCGIVKLVFYLDVIYLSIGTGGDIMSNKKCTEKPPRRGSMTVKVHSYTRKDGTRVDSHKRHTPR